ncbi:MAG: hypothetical protein WCF29_16170, partial [Pseudolabrys sp.]
MADKAQRRIIDTTASESGKSVGYTARASIVSLDSRDNLASSRFSVWATTMCDHMRTKDLQASDEKRAYYRLLRYLVSDELRTC